MTTNCVIQNFSPTNKMYLNNFHTINLTHDYIFNLKIFAQSN